MDPNRGTVLDIKQQNVWAEELRRADERALKFKQDLLEGQQSRKDLENRLKELQHGVAARDQEIVRLGMLYKGGQTFDQVKSQYDRSQSDSQLQSLQNQNNHLNEENHRLSTEMQEIKELLGVCESRDPTDVNRAHLKKLVRELKQRNDQMTQEAKELEKVVEQLKSGRYNEMEAGRHMSRDELDRLKRQLEDAERAREDALKENSRVKSEADKISQY